jgi:paired amphipathic helix protein Sin3a
VQTSNVRSDLKEDFKINFTQDETEFFKRVKTYISNEATYNAFVKVLNLFSQQMVDQDMLVSRVENFIGSNNELFDWFKELIGYEGKDHVIDNVPLGEKQTTKATMLENEHAYICGPSYRQISSSWQGSICSGRDALCWDVLNDGYMSCPTWSSEDTGYVTAKKNQYEEALHRVEEERYDYDLNIEANLNTIALLEPIVKKMTLLSVQEKQSFKLAPGLGGTCTTNYRRIIKKIYGNEKGLEIIDLLYNNPMQTVPIVLKRLKHKDDEWKRAQREWNKIWREVEAKNYQKSLDYKGIAFKLADKKKLAGRALVAEADEKRCQKTNPYFSYSFTDTAIFKDIARMIRFFLEKQPVYGSEDCGLMREFIDTFTSAYFDVSDVEPSVVEIMDTTQLMEADDDDKSSVQSVDSESVKKKSAIARANRRLRRGRPQQQDGDKLLKGVLKRNLNKKKSTDSSDDEDDDEDLEDDEEDEEYDAEEDGDDYDDDDDDDARRKSKRFQQKNQSNTPIMTDVPKQETKKTFNFFGNNGFYCFFRLYQTLYERLWTMKKLDLEFKEDPEKAIDARNEAYNLGVTHRKFKALNMDEKKGYYHLLLSLVDKLFEGDLDQQTFEASTRYIFGNDAYIIFTIDKLVLSILRYVSSDVNMYIYIYIDMYDIN